MQPNEETSESNRSHSLFEDPAIAQAATEDPFVRYMSKNWRKVLTTVIVLALGWYGYTSFLATQQNKQAALSQLASSVRDAYQVFATDEAAYRKAKSELDKNKDEAKKAELTKKLEEAEATKTSSKEKVTRIIQALGDADTRPYPQVVGLYKGLVALKSGELETAKSTLGQDLWNNKNIPLDSPERFFGELGALSLARTFLDTDGKEGEAKEILFKLAENGTISAVPAGLALEAVVADGKERERLVLALESIKTREPEQEKFLTEALERLK